MTGETVNLGNPPSMRANRRVVQCQCGACGRGFEFGEEVVPCNSCGGFHHLDCWKRGIRCASGAQTLSARPPASPSRPAPDHSPAEVPTQLAPRVVPVTSEIPPPPAPEQPQTIAPRLPGRQARATQRVPVPEPPAEPLGVAGSAAAAPFQDAVHPSASSPDVEQSLGIAQKPEPLAGERRCPQCAEIIKAEALQCRFCGHVLNAGFKTPPAALLAQANSDSNQSLGFGIAGILICAPIFGTLAITKANEATHIMDRYPYYPWGRGKANTGRILGICDWVLFVIALLIRFGSMS